MSWSGATYCTHSEGRCSIYWPEHRKSKRAPIYYTVTIMNKSIGKEYSLLPPDNYTRANSIDIDIEHLKGESQQWFARFISGEQEYRLYVLAYYGWKHRRIRVRSITEWLRDPQTAPIYPVVGLPKHATVPYPLKFFE